MDVKARTESYREELLTKLAKLVAINSEEGTPAENAPFGTGPRDALVEALKMMEEDGFKTVNLDNYAGYAEMGEGDQVIGVIGHLDIVPAHKEDGWNTDPFVMTEKDGMVYGRGVADDKGAVVASMIAMKILRDMNVPMKKRVRLIMGTNEETGSRGLKYYVQKEGSVDLGFTPDGDFPGVHGEKGMLGGVYRSKKTSIRDIKGGTAGNVVCRNCYAVVDPCTFSSKALEDWFNNNNLDYSIEKTDAGVKVSVQGVAAHASLPELGVNAISYLLEGLRNAGFQDPFVEFYHSHFGLYYDGTGMGAKCEDDYGALTWNHGVIFMKDGVITGTIDIRFPVTLNPRKVLAMMKDNMADEGGEVEFMRSSEPLFFPVDSPLVTSLLDAYQEVTGDMETQPMTIGGGTYAKSINNTIAFGCAFPGHDYHIHDANEECPVDELLKQVEIYVAAIIKLLNV